MTSEMTKKAHHDIRDGQKVNYDLRVGQKGSLWHQNSLKRLIMVSEIVKKAYQDLGNGQKGSL